MKKLILSVFIVMNLGTVLLVNFIPSLPAKTAQAARGVMQYAHLVGLDNRWEMFSTLHRFDWAFLITAKYQDGSELVLPLPRQMRRTRFEDLVVDFREAKFHLNMYADPWGRFHYGRFLCKRFPTHNGSPVRFIQMKVEYQDLLTRAVAQENGFHSQPLVNHFSYADIPCDVSETFLG